ncbi:MAG: hypothetical protein WAW26_27440, partial [Anaerolineae bacterium]
ATSTLQVWPRNFGAKPVGLHTRLPRRYNRSICCSNIDEPGDGYKLFKGVDFMILHNLAQTVFDQ